MNNQMFKFISRTLGDWRAGRLHESQEQLGKVFINSDGQEFMIFKQTILDPASGVKTNPEAMFRVKFQVPKILPWRDRLIITIKSPIFVALPGFRSKLWMVDEKTNTYQGVYEWDTLKDAEDYVHSASMDFMTEVSIPGGISYEVIPGGRVVQKGPALYLARNSSCS